MVMLCKRLPEGVFFHISGCFVFFGQVSAIAPFGQKPASKLRMKGHQTTPDVDHADANSRCLKHHLNMVFVLFNSRLSLNHQPSTA
jgi:hypothetical protein